MLEDGTVVGRTRMLPPFRIGAIVAIAVAAAFVSWLVTRNDSSAKPVAQAAQIRAAPPLATPAAVPATPQLVSRARLHALAATLDHPVFWVGGRAGMRYELTNAGDGRTYIRYLPANVIAGDLRPDFLAVGTYVDADAFAKIEAAGRRPGAVTMDLPLGGLAVYDAKKPTSVYFAYPSWDVQVEVYAPDGRVARRLVVASQVVPIR